MKKSMTKQLKEAKKRLKSLEQEICDLRDDRNKFREYHTQKIRWFLELHGSGKSPNMSWLIEDMAKFMNKVERWYW